jgi:hypothetical protein
MRYPASGTTGTSAYGASFAKGSPVYNPPFKDGGGGGMSDEESYGATILHVVHIFFFPVLCVKKYKKQL